MSQLLSGVVQMSGGVAGGLGAESSPFHEYSAIMKSYAFTITLISENRLAPILLNRKNRGLLSRLLGGDGEYSKWQMYSLMTSRFACNINKQTDDVEISLEDPDPAVAIRILNLYIEALRAKLGAREVERAKAAVETLEIEARTTPDPSLQTQLYELIAKQLEREKLAEVQADFAFVVIDPPVAPDEPDRPKIMQNTLVAGVVLLFVSVLAVLAMDALRRSRLEHRSREQILSPEQPPDGRSTTFRVGSGV